MILIRDKKRNLNDYKDSDLRMTLTKVLTDSVDPLTLELR